MKNKIQSLAKQLTSTTGLQLILIAGSVSLLGFNIGRNTVIGEKEAHRADLPIVRISERLSSKLSFPLIINQLNEAAITSDPNILQDFDYLSLRFWRQLRSFPVDYINYGAEDGSFIGIEKTKDGSFMHNEDSRRFGRGNMFVYSMTNNGERHNQKDIISGMSETHQEAWYLDTVKAGKPTWSEIYAWEDQPETFSISYNAPIFNTDNKLIGVVGVDMILNRLSTWLQEAWKDQSGIALIVETNGDIVASSKPNNIFVFSEKTIERANINDLKSPLARLLSNQFLSKKEVNYFVDENKFGQRLIHSRNTDVKHFLTKATPWGQEFGLKWYLITATPANEEIGIARRNLVYVILISLSALLTALVINRRLIKAILTPLGALTAASQRTEEQISAKSKHETNISFKCNLQKTNVKEFLNLYDDISCMVEAFNLLTQNLRDQEKQIIELFEEKQEEDKRALSLMSNKLKASLEAASIAHEINQPLSILRATSQSLLRMLTNKSIAIDPYELSKELKLITSQSEEIMLITDKVRSLLRNINADFSPIDLNKVILNSVHYINSNYQGIEDWIAYTPNFSMRDSQAIVNGDAIQLQIALINICKNSIEALRASNTPYPEIIIKLRENSDCWIIEIQDNGSGISQQIDYQAPLESSKSKGTGLGLFIAQMTMESHKGQLSLQNSSSGGLVVQLSLPKQVEHP
ncbi:ATP-binding protein [Synechococcus sp. AH-551-E02]|nr:ATP-binding protein [Synechococcus sp. AH-551-E02]MDB4653417.1 ATP-binding protein [Synechococcus sp. AH-551-E02]